MALRERAAVGKSPPDDQRSSPRAHITPGGKPPGPPFWEIPFVAALAAFMLWVRLIPAKALVLGERAYYVGTDPFYHYRETLGIVRAFPRVPRFDPWTFYPYGTPTNQFGTLFDWLAAAYVVLTQGKDASEEYVQHVLGIYPAILGALLLIPFYLLAKRLLGTAGAVIASITLALLPGEFVVRSMAGYPDHHVAEALAALLSILGVFVAAERGHAARDALRAREWGSPVVRRAILFGALGGIALGLNFYVWPPALLFLGILGLWLTIAILVERARGDDGIGLAAGGAISFLVAGLLMVPVLETTDLGDFNAYGLLHVLAPIAAALWFLALDRIAGAARRRGAPAWALPAGIGALLAIVVLAASLLAERFVGSIFWGLSWVTGIGVEHTTLTLAEASPTAFFCSGDTSTALCLASDFGILPGVTLLLLLPLAYWSITRRRRADLLLLVWSLVIFRATNTQVRFSYYLALNMALLVGWAAARVAEWVALEGAAAPRPVAAKGRKAKVVETRRETSRPLQLAAVAAVLILVLPGNVFASDEAKPVWKATDLAPDANLVRWLEGLAWMRDHTPDAGVDLGLIAARPPPGEPYDHAPGTYGVLSWADYGHWIEAAARRPPVSNPFQQAASLSSTWLTETDPVAAETMLDEWVRGEGPIRYVWIDDQMATGKYGYITVWANAINESRRVWSIEAFTRRDLEVNGSARPAMMLDEDYQDAMMTRLYKGDAVGLSHYRLVYEHPATTTIGSVIYDNGDQRCVNVELPSQPCPVGANPAAVAQWKADPMRAVAVAADNNVYDVDVYSRLKLFERVEGARLVGTTAPDANVTAEVALESRHDATRARNWTHIVTARSGPDGSFEIVFPYPTSELLSPGQGGTDAIVKATSKVLVRAPTGTAELDVTERAVLAGERIEVLLFA